MLARSPSQTRAMALQDESSHHRTLERTKTGSLLLTTPELQEVLAPFGAPRAMVTRRAAGGSTSPRLRGRPRQT